MEYCANKGEPYVLFLDTENVDGEAITKAEGEFSRRCLYIKERRAYERSNRRIGGMKRQLLKSMGYTFIDIGHTTRKNAVDTAIKADMWTYLDRHQKRMMLVSQDGGFSQFIEDLSAQQATIVVPKLSRTSKKLKPHAKQVLAGIPDWGRIRDALTDRSSVAQEIEKLKEKLGPDALAAFQDMTPDQECELMRDVMKEIKKNRAVYVNHWIYTRHLTLIVGDAWATAIVDHIRRNAQRYDIVESEKGSKQYPILTHRLLADSFEETDITQIKKVVAKDLSDRISKHLPTLKKGKTKQQIEQIVEEVARINEAFNVFQCLVNGKSNAADTMIAHLDNIGKLKRA